MPHIVIHGYKGRSPEFKKDVAEKFKAVAVENFGCDPCRVSVAFKEFDKEDWAEKVYKPEIMANKDKLIIEPGYTMD